MSMFLYVITGGRLVVVAVLAKSSQPSAVNGSAVNSMYNATFFGTDLATATPGVEQNKPVFTLSQV